MVSVGQQAYVGLGGYALMVCLAFFGLPPSVSILGAMVVPAAAKPYDRKMFSFCASNDVIVLTQRICEAAPS